MIDTIGLIAGGIVIVVGMLFVCLLGLFLFVTFIKLLLKVWE